MASRMVMAYGDSGMLESIPAEAAVEIGCIPLGQGNEKIPATVRYCADKSNGRGVPLRVRRIKLPPLKNGQRYAYLEFDCTPYVRYTLDSVPVYGHWQSCAVRNSADAADPIFSGLSSRDRTRIARAGKVAGQLLGEAV